MMLEPIPILAVTLADAGETLAFGEKIGRVLVSGDSLALTGPLGAGKTQLARGLAAGLGVPPEYHLTSPTFTLMAQFPCREGLFYHLDLYRLPDENALWEMGFFDILQSPGVMAVEWWDRFLDTWRPDTLAVRLSDIPGKENARRLEMWTLSSGDWESRVKRIQSAL